MSAKETPTRADVVRQRRKQEEARRPNKRPAARASQPTPTLPRRGVTLDASTQRVKPQTRPVRKYEAAAPAPVTAAQGAARVPALPRIHLRVGWRLLSFFLFAVLGAAIYFAWISPLFRVSPAIVIGSQMLAADEIESALRLSGQPVYLIVPAEVENALRLTFPEIISAEVSVDLPNKVTATIMERQPIIRWEQDSAYAWVDADGVIFRPRGERSDLTVVSASGSPPAGLKSEVDALAPIPYVAAPIVESIRLLAPNVPQGSVLLYDPKYGLGWVDAHGWTVWFGADPAQTDVKLRVYAALVESILGRGITPTFINVTYPSAPYYRVGQ